ncbi:hypothetical protein [Chryseobacterium sp.]|uniref:hypothetical protein n=1 Tax=Chryseobacterium sp. TaxID=1871047 RepID=UPI00321B473C
MNNTTYTDDKGNVGVLNTIAIQELADSLTLTVHDSGKTVFVGVDAKTVTLPPTMKGLKFTFVNTGDDGNNIVKVSPDAVDGISGTVGSVTLDGAINKAAQNTKATAKTGDNITIIGTGVKGPKAWIVISGTGVWAKEA